MQGVSWGWMVLLHHLDLLHLFSHPVDLVLLEGCHVCHAHGSLLLLLVVEIIHRIALGSVRGELGLVLCPVEGHDGIFGIRVTRGI